MKRIGFLLALSMAGSAMGGTLLTFDVNQVTNFIPLSQSYGDRVSGPADGTGTYGTDNGTYTPNVVVSYGGTPRAWTTGYGNLTNVHFNDDEGGDIVVTLTADAGFLVTLQSFDIASFGGDRTLNNTAISVQDGNNAPLFSLNGPLVVSGTTRNSILANVTAQQLVLRLHLSQLSTFSDDVGLDNLLFSQQVDGSGGVPEPATYGMVAGALVGLMALRRR